MHRLKDAMMRLIANDGPLGPEWRDHALRRRMSLTRPPPRAGIKPGRRLGPAVRGPPLASGG